MGDVNGRSEKQVVVIRTDLKDIKVTRNGSFFRVEAYWENEDAEPTLLKEGNTFDRYGVEMFDSDTPWDEWDPVVMVGRLTPEDLDNLYKFDKVESMTVEELVKK